MKFNVILLNLLLFIGAKTFCVEETVEPFKTEQQAEIKLTDQKSAYEYEQRYEKTIENEKEKLDLKTDATDEDVQKALEKRIEALNRQKKEKTGEELEKLNNEIDDLNTRKKILSTAKSVVDKPDIQSAIQQYKQQLSSRTTIINGKPKPGEVYKATDIPKYFAEKAKNALSYEELEKVWNELQQEKNRATKEEAEKSKAIKEALRQLNQFKNTESDEWKKANKIYKNSLGELTATEGRLHELEASEKAILANAKKEYADQLEKKLKITEKITIKPVKEPSWWSLIKNKAKEFFNKVKLQFTSDPEQIISIRNDLATIYIDLGKGGLLDKARNTARQAEIIDDLQEKIEKHLVAVQEYEEASKQAPYKPDDKEFRAAIVDLIRARGQLQNLSGVDIETKAAFYSVIDDVLNKIGITADDRRELDKQAWFAKLK